MRGCVQGADGDAGSVRILPGDRARRRATGLYFRAAGITIRICAEPVERRGKTTWRRSAQLVARVVVRWLAPGVLAQRHRQPDATRRGPEWREANPGPLRRVRAVVQHLERWTPRPVRCTSLEQ